MPDWAAGKFSMTTSNNKGKHFIVYVCLIIILSFAGYMGSLNAPFQFDDIDQIAGTSQGMGGSLLSVQKFVKESRIIGKMSFAVNRMLHDLSPWGFRVTNILLHTLNGILIYLIVIACYSTPRLSGTRYAEHKNLLAVSSAILFAVHPLQTQAVTYIVQRFSSLCTFWYLLGLLSFIRFRLAAGKQLSHRAVLYVLMLLSVVLAMKTKEIAFTLPVAIIACEYMFFGKEGRNQVLLLPVLGAMLIIPLTLIGIQKPVGDIISDVSQASQETALLTRSEYLYTQLRVIVTYLRLCLFPVNLNLDYDYPIAHSLLLPETLLSLIIVLLFLSLGIAAVRYVSRSSQRDFLLVGFGVIVFYLGLSVESSVIPIRDVIFEHRMYLPSTGLAMAAPVLALAVIDYVFPKKRIEVFLLVLCLMTAFLFAGTIVRNEVWKGADSLWIDSVKKSPAKARPYNNLGFHFLKTGQYNRALTNFQAAIQRDPFYRDPYNNLGLVYMELQDNNNAEKYFKLALQLSESYPDPLINLGSLYAKSGRYAEAIEMLQRALKLQPHNAGIYNNLGVISMMMNDSSRGVQYLKEAVRMDPAFHDARRNLQRALEAAPQQE